MNAIACTRPGLHGARATPGQAQALVDALAAPLPGPAGAMPVTLVVAAHPDDETVGAGSRLARLAQAFFVHVTDGSPTVRECGGEADGASGAAARAAYALLRRRELEAALRLCGIGGERLLGLGVPDQEASHAMADIATRLAGLMTHLRIEAVLTHPLEGGHPDHDATAFAVHAAVALLERAGATAPGIAEMTSYHQGIDGIRPGEFLPGAGIGSDALAVASVRLTPAEQAGKRALLACFGSQAQTLRWFPVTLERFRVAPRYDFLAPPHVGRLFYEGYPWGMTGPRFRQLCAQAMARLGLEGPL